MNLINFGFSPRSRQCIRTLLAAVSFILSLPVPAFAQTPPAANDRLPTIAGELKIVELEAHCKYQVLLDEKVILKTDCHDESSEYYATPKPTIHTYYKPLAGLGNFEELILFQMQMLGNACDGGDLLFLGVRKNGTHLLSKPVPFCGGRQPVITWAPDKVTVFIPGGPPNRGKGYIRSETWVYERGSVKKLKARSPLGSKQSPSD